MIETKWKVILLGLALSLAIWAVYEKGYSDAESKYKLVDAEQSLQDSTHARDAESTQRTREQSFNVVRDTQEAAVTSGMDTIRGDASDLSLSNERLQQQLTTLQASLGRASQDASVSKQYADQSRKAAMVLSDLLEKATRELGLVSGTADEWYLKGTQCQKFYEEIRSR